MPDVTLPATGAKVATELDADGGNIQVVAALIERSAMMFAAQFLQNIAPFHEAGVAIRATAAIPVSGVVTLAALPAASSYGVIAALGMSESDIWFQNIRSNIA